MPDADRRRKWAAATVAAVLLAGAAAATFATVDGTTSRRSGAGTPVALTGTYGAEPGPSPLRYQWIGRMAELRIDVKQPIWLGFRAQSLRRARGLTVSGGGFSATVGVGTADRAFLIGPVPHGAGTLRVTPSPGPVRASPRDPRMLAVFVSDFSALDVPAYVTPANGFLGEEADSSGRRFNWMKQRGELELITDFARPREIGVGLNAVSIGERRELTITTQSERKLTVDPSASAGIRITARSAPGTPTKIVLAARPGPERLGPRDARSATIQISALRASASLQQIGPSRDAALLILVGMSALLAVIALVAVRSLDRAGLLLLALTAPLEVYRTPVLGVNVSLFRIAVLLVAPLAVLRLIRDHPRRLPSGLPVLATYVAIAGACGVSAVAVAGNSSFGGRLAAQILIGVAAAAAIVILGRRSSLRYAAYAYVLGSLPALSLTVFQGLSSLLGGEPKLPLADKLPVAAGLEVTRIDAVTLGNGVTRLKGPFGDPNHLGVYLVLLAGVGLGIMLVRRASGPARRRTWLPPAIVLTAMILTLATYSRTALLGLVTMVVALVATTHQVLRGELLRLRPARLRVVAVIGVVLAVGLIAPLAPTLANRLEPRADVNQVTNAGHGETARAAFGALGHRPLFGVGVGGIGDRLGQAERTSGAHSTYLTVAAELGLVGLLLLLLAALRTAHPLVRHVRALAHKPDIILPAALLSAFCAFLVMNITYDVWWDDFNWVVLGLVLLAPAAARAEQSA